MRVMGKVVALMFGGAVSTATSSSFSELVVEWWYLRPEPGSLACQSRTRLCSFLPVAELDSQLPRKNGDILCNSFLVLSQLISPRIQMAGDGDRER